VDNATLNRFYRLHFLLPLSVALLRIVHIFLLHEKGRRNPLGLSSSAEKIPFHSYFSLKDIVGFIVLLFSLISIVHFSPNALGEPDNYEIANSLKTPPHIVPEWYFLFAYAILRAIPNKLGGVVGLFASILLLLTLPFIPVREIHKDMPIRVKGNTFNPLIKLRHWIFTSSFIMLTFLGAKPVEQPYYTTRQFFTFTYFLYFYSHNPPLYDYYLSLYQRYCDIVDFLNWLWETAPYFFDIITRNIVAMHCYLSYDSGSGLYYLVDLCRRMRGGSGSEGNGEDSSGGE